MDDLIRKVKARQILDSRGNPTVEVEMHTKTHSARAGVPSGASTGNYEAVELRDGGKAYGGKGVLKAVRNVEKITRSLIGKSCLDQEAIDEFMIGLDGTSQKKKLGANAILGVSLANAKLAAVIKQVPLYKHLGKGKKLPSPYFNVLNGGKHADNQLSFQEFMIAPQAKTFSKKLQMGAEIYHQLKKELHKKYGKGTTNVGDEGGFAPEQLRTAKEALDSIMAAIKDAGYKGKVKIAMDVAASEFYKEKKYHVEGKKLSAKQLEAYYLKLIKAYPITSIEDPFDQDDWKAWSSLTKKAGKKVQIVGDDLLVTNVQRIQQAHEEKACNALLLKVNQVGTVTEALLAAERAQEYGWKVMVSHRSGETSDDFIADLAVATACGQIKSGAPCRSERLAKYNRLLRIEENL